MLPLNCDEVEISGQAITMPVDKVEWSLNILERNIDLLAAKIGEAILKKRGKHIGKLYTPAKTIQLLSELLLSESMFVGADFHSWFKTIASEVRWECVDT